jgi:hypothetical protein
MTAAGTGEQRGTGAMLHWILPGSGPGQRLHPWMSNRFGRNKKNPKLHLLPQPLFTRKVECKWRRDD